MGPVKVDDASSVGYLYNNEKFKRQETETLFNLKTLLTAWKFNGNELSV
jgi:hypothetical protein